MTDLRALHASASSSLKFRPCGGAFRCSSPGLLVPCLAVVVWALLLPCGHAICDPLGEVTSSLGDNSLASSPSIEPHPIDGHEGLEMWMNLANLLLRPSSEEATLHLSNQKTCNTPSGVPGTVNGDVRSRQVVTERVFSPTPLPGRPGKQFLALPVPKSPSGDGILGWQTGSPDQACRLLTRAGLPCPVTSGTSQQGTAATLKSIRGCGYRGINRGR